ncbi:hypothetical protein C1H76_5634 [Elsinoe australis]|uniref:Uncharacterized protein n=1 Tax=Elsinoe australis TaxID=40998 RepID=A0A4U7AUM5_9PEZI|nr:hypothetical protein C1H76_5634 [Elsinoe australis]
MRTIHTIDPRLLEVNLEAGIPFSPRLPGMGSEDGDLRSHHARRKSSPYLALGLTKTQDIGLGRQERQPDVSLPYRIPEQSFDTTDVPDNALAWISLDRPGSNLADGHVYPDPTEEKSGAERAFPVPVHFSPVKAQI